MEDSEEDRVLILHTRNLVLGIVLMFTMGLGYQCIDDEERSNSTFNCNAANFSSNRSVEHEMQSYQLNAEQIELQTLTFRSYHSSDQGSIGHERSKSHPSTRMIDDKMHVRLLYLLPMTFITVVTLVGATWSFVPKQPNSSQNHATVFQTTFESRTDRLKQLMTTDLISRGFTRTKLSRQPFKAFESKSESKSASLTGLHTGQMKATGTIVIDQLKQYQTIIGFGGAFTDAATFNIAQFSEEDQKSIIELYYGSEGIGYTLGRVPINSCDFSLKSYNFDNVPNDFALQHFDNNVTHDTEYMIPVMLAAQEAISTSRNEHVGLRLLASPWSPPAWMKVPVNGVQSMVGSSLPNGLIASHEVMQSWALYISKWIAAYTRHGLNIWALTPQNEPAFAAPWEACAYNASFQRSFHP